MTTLISDSQCPCLTDTHPHAQPRPSSCLSPWLGAPAQQRHWGRHVHHPSPSWCPCPSSLGTEPSAATSHCISDPSLDLGRNLACPHLASGTCFQSQAPEELWLCTRVPFLGYHKSFEPGFGCGVCSASIFRAARASPSPPLVQRLRERRPVPETTCPLAEGQGGALPFSTVTSLRSVT